VTPLAHAPVAWLTGLSGAGKTTISDLVSAGLRARDVPHEVLDGDVMRTFLTPDLGFSKEDRFRNVRRVAYVARGIRERPRRAFGGRAPGGARGQGV